MQHLDHKKFPFFSTFSLLLHYSPIIAFFLHLKMWSFFSPKPKTITILIAFYIITVGFQNLLNLPYAGNKIQIPELLFSLILLFFPYTLLSKIDFSKRQKKLLIACFTMFAISLFSLIVTGNGFIEVAGKLYLIIAFILFLAVFQSLKRSDLISFIVNAFFIMGSLLAVISIAGYLLAIAGLETKFVYKIHNYPYFGTIYRLCGPTFTPTMIITLLYCSLFFSLPNYETIRYNQHIKKLLLLLIIVASILTLSKSILLLCLAFYISFLYKRKRLSKNKLLIAVSVACITILISTHFLFIKKSRESYKKYESTPFTTSEKVMSINNIDIIESTYLTLKKTAARAFLENPLNGVGPGAFNDYVSRQKLKEKFPLNIPEYDPHSTYIGALAETGILGFFVLVLFLFLMIKDYCKLKLLQNDPFALSIFLILLFFLIEGISTDIMNFRHLWVFFAVAFVYFDKKMNNKVNGIQ